MESPLLVCKPYAAWLTTEVEDEDGIEEDEADGDEEDVEGVDDDVCASAGAEVAVENEAEEEVECAVEALGTANVLVCIKIYQFTRAQFYFYKI